MWSKPREVGQLHVVAEDVAQVGIGITWHRELTTFKGMGSKGENLLEVAGIVEGDAHTRGNERLPEKR